MSTEYLTEDIRRSLSLFADSFQVLSIEELKATYKTKDFLEEIFSFYTNYLAKPHTFLGRDGAVCPFVPIALKLQTIFTVVSTVSESEDNIKAYMRRVLDIMTSVNPSEETCIVVFFVDKSISIQTIQRIQRELKKEFVSKGFMIGEFFKGNSSPGLHNPKFFPLQSTIPALAVRKMVREDLPFMCKEEYSKEEAEAYLQSYFKQFPDEVNSKWLSFNKSIVIGLAALVLYVIYFIK